MGCGWRPEEDDHNRGCRKGDVSRASESFRVEGKKLAEYGPGKLHWAWTCQAEELLLSSAGRGQGPGGFRPGPLTKILLLRTYVHRPWLEGVPPSSGSDFHSGHLDTSGRGKYSTNGNKDEIKSVCIFKSLAVWREGRERQMGGDQTRRARTTSRVLKEASQKPRQSLRPS